MSVIVEEKLSEAVNKLRDEIERWKSYNVTTSDEGNGSFLTITDPATESDDYRCISLTNPSDDGFEDVDKFRWTFWTSDHSIYTVSDLNHNSTVYSVALFLLRSMSKETQAREA